MDFSLHLYQTVPLGLVLACLLYVRSIVTWRARSRGRPLPPGPPSLPIVGNLFNVPGDRAWFAFHDLAAQYGDIVHFQIFGQSTVVLGSSEVIRECLEKRAANTSNRPHVPVVELLGQDANFGFMSYGQKWRRYRRHFWQHFTTRAIEQYQPVQRAVAHQFLVRLLDNPSEMRKHMRYTFLATLLMTVYGIGLTEDHSRYAATFDVSSEGVAQGLVPGKYIVDLLPFLKHVPKWVPGFAWQADFERWRGAAHDVRNVPFASTKKAMARGEGLESMVAKTLTMDGSSDEVQGDLEDVAKGIGFVSYAAGADTSFIALQSFFLAMVLYPEAQKKAQAELDAVVGSGRMPDFSDRKSLVYVDALIREVLRWHTVAPLGIAHSTTADDELNGYFIPAGTVLLPNIWACMHDPTVYEDPHVFRPERFIRDGKLDPSIQDPLAFVFGFGRRICPGRHYAEAAMFINVVSVLHAFDITPPLDADGRPTTLDYRMTSGFISYPEDARCTIKPRSAEAAALIMAHA